MPQQEPYTTDYQRAIAHVFYEPNNRIEGLRLYLLDNPDTAQFYAIHSAINEYIKKTATKNLKSDLF